jgi:DNA-binding winged helix-turn-helix (wHTH) protein
MVAQRACPAAVNVHQNFPSRAFSTIVATLPRYRFAGFVLSPRQRVLLRGEQPLTLIPRYFDLLVFLVERRGDAVHRRDIFDRVWADVIVSDSALSQAIRTLRRTLGDDVREPLFIRTVSRHGYQFVCADVVEEEDDARGSGAPAPPPAQGVTEGSLPLAVPAPESSAAGDPFAPLLALVTAAPDGELTLEDQRDAAERLHLLGTERALERLTGHARIAQARALMRDTRHLVNGAGPVPILGQPQPMATALRLVAMRLRRAAPLVVRRSLGGGAGGALAGAFAGLAGGLLLSMAPHSEAPVTVAPVLALLGIGCGLVGGAGVAAGLGLAEALALSWRLPALVLAGSIGGGIVGGVTQVLASWTLGVMFGLDVPVGGAIQGLVLGAGIGFGYAVATRDVPSGLAAPRGHRRVVLAATTMLAGALAALVLALVGLPLAGGTVHAIAQATAGSRLALTPIGQLVGEPGFGPVTRALIAMGEGGLFGCGLAVGLTRRF